MYNITVMFKVIYLLFKNSEGEGATYYLPFQYSAYMNKVLKIPSIVINMSEFFCVAL